MKSIDVNIGGGKFSEPVPYSLAQFLQKEGYFLGNHEKSRSFDFHQEAYIILKPTKLNKLVENGINRVADASGMATTHALDNLVCKYDDTVKAKTGIQLKGIFQAMGLDQAAKDIATIVLNPLAHKNMQVCASFFIEPVYGREFGPNQMLVEAYIQNANYKDMKSLTAKLDRFYKPRGYNIIMRAI